MSEMKIELNKDELWMLIEVLDAHRESIEHLGDTDYDAKLEALESKLRKELK
jgi:hypothetical protein